MEIELIEREFKSFFKPLYGSDSLIMGKSCRDFAAHIAILAAEKEREACAKVCETFSDRVFDTNFTPMELEHPFSTIAGANQCAADIRARKQETPT